MLRSDYAMIKLFRQAKEFKAMLKANVPYVSRGIDYPDVSATMSKGLPYFFLYELRPSQAMNAMLYQVTAFDQEGIIQFLFCQNHSNSLWYWYRQGVARTTAAIERSVRHAYSMHGVYLNKEKPFDRVDEHVYQINPDWVRMSYLSRLHGKD